MSIIVERFSVNTGERIYGPGEVISALSEQEEQNLVDAGFCRYPDVVVVDPDVIAGDPPQGDQDPPVGGVPNDDGGPQTGIPEAGKAKSGKS